MPPHIFSISDNAYNDMLRERHNQSMLITGKKMSKIWIQYPGAPDDVVLSLIYNVNDFSR